MHIETHDTAFLLFMEPTLPPEFPIIDEYTRKMAGAFRNGTAGGSGYSSERADFCPSMAYKGWHACSCGATSSNADYLLKTSENLTVNVVENARAFFNGNTEDAQDMQAVITNSLSIHYIACHRKEIKPDTLARILLLEGDSVEPSDSEVQYKR